MSAISATSSYLLIARFLTAALGALFAASCVGHVDLTDDDAGLFPMECPDGSTWVGGECVTEDICASVDCGPGRACEEHTGRCVLEDQDDDQDGVTVGAGDCDDGNSAVFPGAPEQCNGVDDDCDRVIDEGQTDEDGDGFDRCGANVPSQADCDDGNSAVFPGAPEQCNGVDDDCDGATDEDVADQTCTTECGAGTSRCVAGRWQCSVPETCECTPEGLRSQRSCGRCGTESRTCGPDLTWSDWGACTDQGDCDPGQRSSCTTSCSTAGQQVCGDECSYGSCVPPEESCNGVDDDCDDGCDEGAGCRRAIHRYYHDGSMDTMYTDGSAPPDYELVTGSYFYLSETAVSGTTAFYQCHYEGLDHYYRTASECAPGYVNEGVIGYIRTTSGCGTVPLYRFYRGGDIKDHFYSLDADGEGIPASDEGIAGYVWLTE